ncbi:MAG: hypothetical protein H6843_00360 [Rhodospirillaceae bacterium]|nr:hypothetical protein [Rhodospirillaceae bacterium]
MSRSILTKWLAVVAVWCLVPAAPALADDMEAPADPAAALLGTWETEEGFEPPGSVTFEAGGVGHVTNVGGPVVSIRWVADVAADPMRLEMTALDQTMRTVFAFDGPDRVRMAEPGPSYPDSLDGPGSLVMLRVAETAAEGPWMPLTPEIQAAIAQMVGTVDDYSSSLPYLGIGPRIQALLPGHWMIVPVRAQDMADDAERLQRACENASTLVERRDPEGYAFTLTRHDRDGGRFEMASLVWGGNSRFLQVRNLPDQIDFLRIREHPSAITQPVFNAWQETTILPLSDAVLLQVGGLEVQIWLRCP